MFYKKQAIALFSGLLFCFTTVQISAQTDYSNYSKFSQRLKTLQSQNVSNSKLETLTTTVGGHKIWTLTLSKGDAKNKPAIAIVSGVDGMHILGPEMALQIAEKYFKKSCGCFRENDILHFP